MKDSLVLSASDPLPRRKSATTIMRALMRHSLSRALANIIASRISAFVAGFASAALCCAFALPIRAEDTIFEDTFALEPRRLTTDEMRSYPDPAKWAFTFWPGVEWPTSFGDGTNWLQNNAESQVYTSRLLDSVKGTQIPLQARYDPFRISSDGLHIQAAKLTSEQQRLYHVGGHRRFGSGMLLSRISFTHGKVRMVAQLPNARGSWPALWLLPKDRRWPPEIDVFEAMVWGSRKRQLHVGIIGTESDGNFQKAGWTDIDPNPSNGFHEYGLDWDRDNMSFLFDGRVLRAHPTPPSLQDREMYVLVTLTIGGKWPYNELGIEPIDGTTPERLEAGASTIEPDYPSEMIIRSLKAYR